MFYNCLLFSKSQPRSIKNTNPVLESFICRGQVIEKFSYFEFWFFPILLQSFKRQIVRTLASEIINPFNVNWAFLLYDKIRLRRYRRFLRFFFSIRSIVLNFFARHRSKRVTMATRRRLKCCTLHAHTRHPWKLRTFKRIQCRSSWNSVANGRTRSSVSTFTTVGEGVIT